MEALWTVIWIPVVIVVVGYYLLKLLAWLEEN
jgi:hypothetical protein